MTVLASDSSILASSTGVLSSGYDGGFIMALASGTNSYLAYELETARGVLNGAEDMTFLRVTGKNVNLQKNTIRSAEVRSDRQSAALRHGFNQVVGAPGFELSLSAFDDLIQGAMSGTWAAVSTAASQDIAVAATTTTAVMSRTAGSFLTDGYEVGMLVLFTGLIATGNDQQSRITALSADGLDMTVEAADGATSYTTEVADSDETCAAIGEVCKIGSTLRTYTIERGFTDVDQYQIFKGCAVNQMSVQIQPEQMVGGSFDLLGMSAEPMAQTARDASITAAPTNDPMSAFEGQLSEGGAESSVVTGMNFTLNNNRSLEAVVGDKFSPDVFEGTAMITGEATVFFENETLFNKFVNETISSLSVQMDDLNGTDFIVVGFPAIKYTGGDMDPPQQGPVPITMPFEAQVSATTANSMYIQKSNT